MFEIEHMNETFDYSLVDNETAEFLKEREYTINGIAEDARIKIGRELKKAQDKLANHDKGIFYKWFESGGLNKNQVYYYINLVELSTNLDNLQKDNFLNAPKSLQKEVMKKNAPDDLKQKVLDGDITTHKEYKQLQKDKEELEQQNAQLQSQVEQAQRSEEIAKKQLEDAESREPEVVEKEIVKEIVPDRINKQLENLKNDKKLLEQREKELSDLKRRFKEREQQPETNKYERDSNLTEEEQIASIRFQVETNLLALRDDANEFLDKAAHTPYREAAIARASQRTKNMMFDVVEEMEAWTRQMRNALNTSRIVGEE
ncbi:hypothetical protein [Staphylococcus haemolyticus]|uniref:hypothetical protein n=1 Tax=Staphylococcus haemolyticus TaxID=1283 RepID=UPI001F0AFE88|nr:hypothetical protein [Staphylococcus haemolyticus]MCH4414496.1 hypothetical protein [Staphylococcus haemolyticus]